MDPKWGLVSLSNLHSFRIWLFRFSNNCYGLVDMTPPFIYGPPMGPESFRAMSMVPPLPPMIFPPPNENPLTSSIVKQIDFYFR